MDETKEVERLRARVAELEAQMAKTEEAAPPSPEKRGRGSVWWAVSSAVLITLACVLAPLSVVSVWASSELSDTEQYVETVAPLADDPAVQDALAAEITTTIFENLDVEDLTSEALATIAAQPDVPPRVAAALPALATPIANGVQSFTRDQVDSLLASPQFAQLWAQVNRVAHEQVVKLLEGNQGGAVSAQDGTITLNLAPIIEEVKTRLVAQGFDLANNIPAVDKSFVLAESDAITDAQGFYSLLNTLGVWLPIVALALFAVGVALARDRRRALLKGGLGLAAAMVVLGVALTLVRMWYVETTPAGILTAEAAGSVFDTLVRFLRTGLRAVAVLGLVVALAAFLTGPSAAAVKTRATLERGIGSAREGAESAGWDTGRVGSWTFAHRRALRISAVIAGGLVLMFWSRPTGWVVVSTALLVVLALAVIEFLATPPVQAAPAHAEASGAGVPEEPVLPRQVPRADAETPTATEKTLQPSEKGADPHV
ncbi:MAG TPA: hypothetical protein VFJ83_15135 [Nocardioidaceae bacterium]|nr:hypothetical protein [Nocardioidaceae bacterium]